MNGDTLRSSFERDGFVVVRQFLSGDDFTMLVHELDRYIREVVPTLGAEDAFYVDLSRPETLKQMQHMDADPFFHQYMRHPQWTGLAEALLGEPVESQPPEWFNKPPATDSPTPPHQDNYYFCLKPNRVLTIWLALDPVDDENGCLRYVPGSHLRGVRPHGRSYVLGFSQGITNYGPADEAVEVKVHLEPGDAVVHHGDTIHRAEANRSTWRSRRAFAMVMRGVSCRRDEAAYERYLAALRQQHEDLGVGPPRR